MNTENRKELQKAHDLITEAESILDAIRDDEQEKFDNLSEGFQAGEKGERIQECADQIEEARDGLNESLSKIDDAIQ